MKLLAAITLCITGCSPVIRHVPEPPGVDHWQSPRETVSKGYGDCEDIAILNYYNHLQSGKTHEELRLVYGKLNGEAHMTYEVWDGNQWVGENLTGFTETFKFNTENLYLKGQVIPSKKLGNKLKLLLKDN